MAHQIDMSNGKAACFTVGEAPWHKLGRNVQSAQTSESAMQLAGLNWTVEKWELTANAYGNTINVPNQFATVRTDTAAALGVVGKDYKVFQNAESFDFMDQIVGEKLAMFHTAGSLFAGKKVWVLAKLPQEYRIAGSDSLESYVLICNSHDGTGALNILPTSVRVVCANTKALALRTAGKAKILNIRHSGKLADRVNEARKHLGVIGTSMDQFAAECREMASKSLTGTEARNYFESLFPTTTKRVRPEINGASLLAGMLDMDSQRQEMGAELLEAHHAATEAQAKNNKKILSEILHSFESDRQKIGGISGTAWGAYNAVSEYVDHSRSTRGQNYNDRLENRMESVLFGSGNAIKQDAFESALQLVRS